MRSEKYLSTTPRVIVSRLDFTSFNNSARPDSIIPKIILAKTIKQFEPEELGEIVTKILAFQAQFKAVTTKLDSTVEGLIKVLKDNVITLPKL